MREIPPGQTDRSNDHPRRLARLPALRSSATPSRS